MPIYSRYFDAVTSRCFAHCFYNKVTTGDSPLTRKAGWTTIFVESACGQANPIDHNCFCFDRGSRWYILLGPNCDYGRANRDVRDYMMLGDGGYVGHGDPATVLLDSDLWRTCPEASRQSVVPPSRNASGDATGNLQKTVGTSPYVDLVGRSHYFGMVRYRLLLGSFVTEG